MEQKEINEYLAEHLFGLKKDIDFGETFNHKIDLSKGTRDSAPCEKCYKYFSLAQIQSEAMNRYSCVQKLAPNYIENYQQVLEKLVTTPHFCLTVQKTATTQAGKIFMCTIDSHDNVFEDVFGYGDTIGEAVCKCAIEYLKLKNQ